jgi:putative Mg2+ transporter-C (MgtC) family protein
MAAGGDLPLPATLTTVIYLLVSYGYPLLTDRLPKSRGAPSEVRLTYQDGQGLLRRLLAGWRNAASQSYLQVERSDGHNGDRPRAVTVRLELRGGGSIAQLAADLYSVEGVLDVTADDVNVVAEN